MGQVKFRSPPRQATRSIRPVPASMQRTMPLQFCSLPAVRLWSTPTAAMLMATLNLARSSRVADTRAASWPGTQETRRASVHQIQMFTATSPSITTPTSRRILTAILPMRGRDWRINFGMGTIIVIDGTLSNLMGGPGPPSMSRGTALWCRPTRTTRSPSSMAAGDSIVSGSAGNSRSTPPRRSMLRPTARSR